MVGLADGVEGLTSLSASTTESRLSVGELSGVPSGQSGASISLDIIGPPGAICEILETTIVPEDSTFLGVEGLDLAALVGMDELLDLLTGNEEGGLPEEPNDLKELDEGLELLGLGLELLGLLGNFDGGRMREGLVWDSASLSESVEVPAETPSAESFLLPLLEKMSAASSLRVLLRPGHKKHHACAQTVKLVHTYIEHFVLHHASKIIIASGNIKPSQISDNQSKEIKRNIYK